jgi:Sap, sulfolipid-1-addressing protein
LSDFLTILPMAVVMVAGPQIVSAVFLATSEQAHRCSIAYLLGVALSIAIGVTLVYTVARLLGVSAPTGGETGKSFVDYVIIVLLLLLAVRVFLRRNESEPPKWMGKLESATPRFAFKLGFLLFLLMPTDVITMVVVGLYLARRDDPLFYAVPFLLLTVLLVSIPLLVLLILGDRAEALLPKVRAWMNANSWVVSEIVIVFFLILFL